MDCRSVYSTRDFVPCPVCGSWHVAELVTCELCKGAVLEAGTRFCRRCREAIDKNFKDLFAEIKGYGEIPEEDVPTVVFDRAEEVGFYEQDQSLLKGL